MEKTLVIVFLCGLVLPGVTGLVCYDCEGIEGCGDLFDKDGPGVTTCSTAAGTYCIKTKGGQFGDDYVTRGCSAVKPITGTCEQMGSGNFGYESCYCQTDFCNTSTQITGRRWVVFFVASLSIFLLHW